MPRKPKLETDFDFVSPHSITECADRLSKLQELREIDFAPQMTLQKRVIKTDLIEFTLHESHPAAIKITGWMNRLDEGHTYISGTVLIQHQVYQRETLPLAAIVVGIGPVVGWGASILLLGLLGAFSWRTITGSQREQARLIELLKDTLAY